jgi:hypothetical protein
MTKTIAVDVEGVLADSHEYARRLSEEELPEEEMKSWGFSNDEYMNTFLGALSDGWHNDWESIAPVTESNRMAMILLNEFFEVHIVTTRTNADDEIKSWLSKHEIPYDEFHSTKTYKEDLGYDSYVDDNPHMVDSGVDLYLHDQSWNKHVRANKRVRNLLEAATHLIINEEEETQALN